MKKIIFCLQTMIMGGVEKELVTILKKMSPEKYDISLLVMYESDKEIMKTIPPHIKIINLDIDKNYYCDSCVELCKQRIKNRKYIEAGALALKRVCGIGMTHSNTNIKNIIQCNEYYDTAVCYHIHSPLMLRYVAEKISASKKIAWIHNDFETTKYPINKLQKYLLKYSEIIAVSNKVKKEFENKCPKFIGRVRVCHNIVDEEDIIEKSKYPIEESIYINEKKSKLLTIGRFTHQKGFDVAIKCAYELKNKGVDFKWFFIGAGEQEAEYRRMITSYDMEDQIIILGRKNNPYPYLKECKIYVQPSRHEAYSIAILEAKALSKPIICSDFAGANEQIINDKTGVIVPVGDVDKLSDEIEKLLIDENKRNNFTEELKKEKQNDSDWLQIENCFL